MLSELVDSVPAWVGAGVLFAIGVAALIARRYVSRNGGDQTGGSAEDIVEGDTSVTQETNAEPVQSGETPGFRHPEPIAVARERLNVSAYSEAVEVSYGAVREAFGGGPGDTRTHWEFYEDTASEVPDEGSDALETLTEAYEQARFAPAGVDGPTAASAVDAAAACLEAAPATDGGTDEDDPSSGD